jgi:lipopolysaccharide export system permease protein
LRILDRYIIKNFLASLFYCLFIFAVLYVVVDVFSNLDEIIKSRTSLTDLRDYYTNLLPIIFVQMAPMSVLLATLYSLGNMVRNREILAMRASGISLLRIVQPYILLALGMSVVVFLVNNQLVPEATLNSQRIKETRIKQSRDRHQEKVLNQLALYGADNSLFYIDRFDPKEKELTGIVILKHDGLQRLTSKVVAKLGRWQDGRWIFYDCLIYKFDENGRIQQQPLFFKERIMQIQERPQDFSRRVLDPSLLSYQALRRHIEKLSGSGAKLVRRLLIELYYKISFSFSSLVVVFLGIPFALLTSRGGALYSIGICMALSFGYYGLQGISLALGKAGFLSPVFSAWMANIIFFSIGLFLFERVR